MLEIASRGLLDPRSPGALWRVGHDGTRRLVTSALTAPGGVAVAPVRPVDERLGVARGSPTIWAIHDMQREPSLLRAPS